MGDSLILNLVTSVCVCSLRPNDFRSFRLLLFFFFCDLIDFFLTVAKQYINLFFFFTFFILFH